MSAGLPDIGVAQGPVFVPVQRVDPDDAPFGSMDEKQLRSWVADRWYEAFEGKRAETERLKTNELYYAGFHYTDPFLNRTNPVTNFCYSTVETMHPILTEDRPRPEARPRNGSLDSGMIDHIQNYATWKMDATAYDRVVRVAVRDVLKFGYGHVQTMIDPNTGLSYPRYLSPFHYYPDPTATDDSEIEYYVIARPVSTRRLLALFPNALGKIKPDNMADPGYDVFVRPYFQVFKETNRFDGPSFISANLFRREGETTPSGGTPLVAGTGQHQEHGHTTFVLQVYVRDHGQRSVTYLGDWQHPDPDDELGRPITIPGTQTIMEPACPSGWRVITMTADGVFLEPPRPLDPCFLGPNVRTIRMAEPGARFWNSGVLDNVIPLQRQYNRRQALIARALELAANPPVKALGNTGLSANQTSVDAGELLKLKPGSNIEYLGFQGPAEQHFEQLAGLKTDMQIVSGAQDSVMGKRPAGIEAASAIRELQNAASVRIRGIAPVVMDGFAKVLEQMLAIDGRKAQGYISYYVDGAIHSIDPSDLQQEVSIRWAEGSGMIAAKQDYQDRLLDYFDRGIVDAQYVIQMTDLPGGDEVLQRIQAMQQQQMAMQAKAAAQAGKGGAPPKSGGK